jgi:hypothetical protein
MERSPTGRVGLGCSRHATSTRRVDSESLNQSVSQSVGLVTLKIVICIVRKLCGILYTAYAGSEASPVPEILGVGKVRLYGLLRALALHELQTNPMLS